VRLVAAVRPPGRPVSLLLTGLFLILISSF
jgi:hypothetical protein